MAEQIILNTDLYDNLLTERKGDYTAKPRITGTLYNTDIAARIVAARTEYQHGTILNILDMADSHKVQAIAEGKSVVDGVGQYLVNVQGAFEGEKAQFEPGKHALGITYTMGKLLRETLKLVKVVVNSVAAVGPVINTVTDSTSKAINGQLSSGGALVLGGVNLKIQGDDPSIGVYLTPTTEGAAPMKAPVVIANSPSQVIVQMPTLADGQYTVSLTTQYSGSRNVKEPRTYTFPIILIVGEGGGGDSESPDEI
ncbi:DUF4469 domain-containing protein [Parabacteroides distasonis]|uniref:DUF4469 domain-containing protein n=1 Tax=Parabacteroides distasonis TaxID=823 RepID=UPI0012B16786|nr:DUF4469 domain-containing protein [Parabacteroides distasonis]MRY40258.1 DUF4469 domain-containing protein [Parabacteroides distasonis]MRZ10445.1 DUF4469 domain-containing protein [Parabacteroides distasonis]